MLLVLWTFVNACERYSDLVFPESECTNIVEKLDKIKFGNKKHLKVLTLWKKSQTWPGEVLQKI